MDRDILAQILQQASMRGGNPLGQFGNSNQILEGQQPAQPPQALPPGWQYPGYQVPPGATPYPQNPRFNQAVPGRPLAPQQGAPVAPIEVGPGTWARELMT